MHAAPRQDISGPLAGMLCAAARLWGFDWPTLKAICAASTRGISHRRFLFGSLRFTSSGLYVYGDHCMALSATCAPRQLITHPVMLLPTDYGPALGRALGV